MANAEEVENKPEKQVHSIRNDYLLAIHKTGGLV